MTLDNPQISPSAPRNNNAVETLSRLQTEFMSDVLKRAVADAGAAMMHQLGEPLAFRDSS
jgi:hypothetical protein